MSSQTFQIIKALMLLAGFKKEECERGATKWSPIATGDEATATIKRLIGIEALKNGINALVKIETFKRSDLEKMSAPPGCIMNPMLATDAVMCVRRSCVYV